MKRIIPFIIVAFLIFSFQDAISQTYKVGHKVITYKDPARGNRSIKTDVYYPATATGDNTAIVSGKFPVIVFGHGFVMATASLYSYMWNSLVPSGYIILFPTTEGGSIVPPPNHGTFALDLSFLNIKMKNEGITASSFFYNHVGPTSAVMGHSMGGKSATMAASNNANFNAYISLAAAKEEGANNNNVIGNFAPFVTIPSLVIAGEKDCCAPPAENQIPIYDTLASTCKTFISIIEGGHCNFASSSGWCELAQSGECGTLSRQAQNNTVLTFIKPFLDYNLKNDVAAETDFLTKLNSSNAIEFKRECNGTVTGSGFNPFALASVYNSTPWTNINFTLHNVDAYNTYLWDFGDYSYSTSKNPSHKYLFKGTYCVKVRINNYWTGEDTTLFINPCIVIASNNSGALSKNMSTSNGNEITELNISPNPANDKIKVQTNFIVENVNDIIVYDAMGRKIAVSEINKLNDNEVELNIMDLSKGIYYLKIANTEVSSSFLIVR